MTDRTKPGRLEALDAMRGLTIALMILVNTALWGTPVYHHLRHAVWNGLTAADLVFPSFMFIMGVGMAFSLRRYGYRPSGQAWGKILRRTVILFAVGLALDYVEKGISGVSWGLDFSHLRILGVLPRLALSYGFAAALALLLSERGVKVTVGVFLVAYAFILLTMKGFEPSTDNIVARVDLAVLGENHMYHDWVPERIAFDPEGLLGTLPSIAHVLIGYLMGLMLLRVKSNEGRLWRLMLAGSALALTGFLFEAGVPVNKKVWSPTFVLVACGIGAQVLGILIWLVDMRRRRAWLPTVTVFGVNPLFLYVISSIIGVALWQIPVGGQSLPGWLYTAALEPLFGPESGMPSLLYALAVTLLCWLIGYPLWKRHIHISL